MNDKILVMLIEDNVEYSEVIELSLRDLPDIELAHRFGTSEIALRLLRQTSMDRVPDVILLDLRLPGMSGFETLGELRAVVPDAKTIILTQSDSEQDVLRAISLGASGYLLKTATVDQITEGIRTVMAGGASLDADVARFVLQTLRSTLPKEVGEHLLSERETEILSLLAEGLAKKQIAARLEIGYTTVDTHVGRIYGKLNVANAPAAVNKAHRLNLLPPDAAN